MKDTRLRPKDKEIAGGKNPLKGGMPLLLRGRREVKTRKNCSFQNNSEVERSIVCVLSFFQIFSEHEAFSSKLSYWALPIPPSVS